MLSRNSVGASGGAPAVSPSDFPPNGRVLWCLRRRKIDVTCVLHGGPVPVEVQVVHDRDVVLTELFEERFLVPIHEWAAKHGQPYRLTLTGSAGGSWQRGIGDAPLELDAVEFARTMAGRRPPDRGLLRHGVPF